jgi:hypothetical protein
LPVVLLVFACACGVDRYRIDRCITPDAFFERFGPMLDDLGASSSAPEGLPSEIDSVAILRRETCPSAALAVAEDVAAPMHQRMTRLYLCGRVTFRWAYGSGDFADRAYFRTMGEDPPFGGALMRGHRRVGERTADLMLHQRVVVDRESASITSLKVYFDYERTKRALCGPDDGWNLDPLGPF